MSKGKHLPFERSAGDWQLPAMFRANCKGGLKRDINWLRAMHEWSADSFQINCSGSWMKMIVFHDFTSRQLNPRQRTKPALTLGDADPCKLSRTFKSNLLWSKYLNLHCISKRWLVYLKSEQQRIHRQCIAKEILKRFNSMFLRMMMTKI